MFLWRSCRAALAATVLGTAMTAAAASELAQDTQPMKVTVLGYSPQGMAQNLDDYRGLHSLFRNYPRESLVEDRPFHLHLGAAAYYREAGLLQEGSS